MGQATADRDGDAPAEVSHHGSDPAAEAVVPGPWPAALDRAAITAAHAPSDVRDGRGTWVVLVAPPEQGARVAALPAVVEEGGGPRCLARRPAQRPAQSRIRAPS